MNNKIKINAILKEFYVSTRNSNPEEQGAVPITARQLEAIIRLAEASAKLQLKDKVEASDAHRAINLQRKTLEKIGLDPETGKIDIDKVEGRTPTSDRERMNKVIQEIEALEEEFENVPVTVLKENLAEKYDISEEKADSILKQLRGKGIIYEPHNGVVKKS